MRWATNLIAGELGKSLCRITKEDDDFLVTSLQGKGADKDWLQRF